MEFTGERFVPSPNVDLLGAEHIERYTFACRYAHGKSVLDIACGSGYGSRLLLQAGAATVTGVDVSSEAVAFATEKNGGDRIQYIHADAERYNAGHFDLIVSFETIEHLDNRQSFLENLSTMLNENGMLIISTPNKAITSPMKPAHKIRNKYHKYEYVEQEFVSALQNVGFNTIQKFGQHPYPWIFNIQFLSRLLRRWKKDKIETAVVLPMADNSIPRYFVFIARK